MFAASRISDFCLLVEDLPACMQFYRESVGFTLRRHAPGFADFATIGVTLALWERKHFVEHTGIPTAPKSPGARASMSAVEVASPAEVDAAHQELLARGLTFLTPPRWYPWNAYACYFDDPDQHVWEIYAWGEQGHAGLYPL